MNYYKQVIILIKKHLTVDFRWDCNEGINRCVFISVYFWQDFMERIMNEENDWGHNV